jgi:membrane fusion protein, multidrug efflux system
MESNMLRSRSYRYFALLIPALALAAAGCAKSKAQENGAGQAVQSTRLTNVEVQVVRPSELPEYLVLTGTTEAFRDIEISSEQGGTVQSLLVDRGDRVRKGQVLARVNADIYEAQLVEAQANLKLKDAALKKADALFERKSITSMQRLQAQVDYDAAAANADLAKGRLRRAVIEAPFDGVIDDRYVDSQEMVQPGGRLFRLVDRSRIKITSNFAELDVSTFRPGITGAVKIDAFPDTAFEAKLSFVASSAHAASHTFPCEFVLNNQGDLIRGGMYASIRVLKQVHRSVLVVPQAALVETENGRNLFVLDGDKALRRPVTLGASNSGLVIVASGINSEDTIIVTGNRDLVDGQQVRVTGRKD